MAAYIESFCQDLPNQNNFTMPTPDENLADYLTSSVLAAEIITDAAPPPQPLVVCPLQVLAQKRPREEDLGDGDFPLNKFLALLGEGDKTLY